MSTYVFACTAQKPGRRASVRYAPFWFWRRRPFPNGRTNVMPFNMMKSASRQFGRFLSAKCGSTEGFASPKNRCLIWPILAHREQLPLFLVYSVSTDIFGSCARTPGSCSKRDGNKTCHNSCDTDWLRLSSVSKLLIGDDLSKELKTKLGWVMWCKFKSIVGALAAKAAAALCVAATSPLDRSRTPCVRTATAATSTTAATSPLIRWRTIFVRAATTATSATAAELHCWGA